MKRTEKTEKLVAQLPIDPQGFDVYGLRIFGVLPNAKPADVRAGADLLLEMVHRLSLVGSGSADLSKADAALLAQLCTGAAQAAYRSILGEF